MSSGEDEAVLAAVDLGSDTAARLQRARDSLELRVNSEDVIVGPYESKTRLMKLINGGAFGQIFLGKNQDSGEKVAVKIEHPGPGLEQLLYEGQVYRKLKEGPGIPSMFWYGMHGSQFNVMTMELLGPSLQELFFKCNHRFSLKTVLLLIDQMLDTIGFIHGLNFVHRDISSNNFMMGCGAKSHKLYLVDYGLAKQFKPSPSFRRGKLGGSFTFKMGKPMVGTARFCSTFCHKGEEESRRDDLESLAFLWLYFLRGSLPWQGVNAATVNDKLDRIYDLKVTTPVETLCEGQAEEFAVFLNFVRGMRQYDVPDYKAIQELFRGLAAKEGIVYDCGYDWMVDKSEQDKHKLACPKTSEHSSSPSTGPVSH